MELSDEALEVDAAVASDADAELGGGWTRPTACRGCSPRT